MLLLGVAILKKKKYTRGKCLAKECALYKKTIPSALAGKS